MKYFEIAEADLRIQNPISEEKLMLVGEISDVGPDTEILDLACGKGELLARWASEYGVSGTGVDINETFLSAARTRAEELDVDDQVTFEQADAGEYPVADHEGDIASCIGASWIGGGLQGTLELLKQARRDETSLILVGEPYWIEDPPAEAVDALADGDHEKFGTLPEIHDRAAAKGLELIEMVLANQDTWDRYEAAQWKTMDTWLRENPDNPDAEELGERVRENKQTYLEYGRKYFGWGIFVFREQR